MKVAKMPLMRLYRDLALAIGCFVGLLCAQKSGEERYKFAWDREFSESPDAYTPEDAILDSHGVLWVLCRGRIGNQGKEHFGEAVFRIDDQGRELFSGELNLPLSQEQREETSGYRLAALPGGEVGLVLNKIRSGPQGPSAYLGAYLTTLGADGSVAPLRLVGEPGPDYKEALGLTNGDLLLGGNEGAVLELNSSGIVRWRKSFQKPLLVNPSFANLSDGSICMSAWNLGNPDGPSKLRVMRMDPQGRMLHSMDMGAMRGQVAPGPDGTCALLYDLAPKGNNGDYHLTLFDRSFRQQWTTPSLPPPVPGARFSLTRLADGYLAQIWSVLVEYNWSGKEIWRDTEKAGGRLIVTPGKDGFFLIVTGINMHGGFHVKRAIANQK